MIIAIVILSAIVVYNEYATSKNFKKLLNKINDSHKCAHQDVKNASDRTKARFEALEKYIGVKATHTKTPFVVSIENNKADISTPKDVFTYNLVDRDAKDIVQKGIDFGLSIAKNKK